MDKRILIFTSVVLGILVVFSSFAGGMFLGRVLEHSRAERYAQGLPSVQKVQEAVHIIEEMYVDDVSMKKVITGAVKGAIDAVGDPYSHYLDLTHYNAFKEQAEGHFDGVGIVVSESKNHEIVVVSPIEGTPAFKAGIKTHDVIIKINNKPTKGMTVDAAVKLIRGKRGTAVSLTMRREGEKNPLTFKLVREQINIPNVTSKKINKDIGYVRLIQFNERTSDEVKEHYDKLKSQGVKGIIFDLRHNPGGILEEAIDLGSMWIPEGPIVKIKSREGDIDSQDATGGADITTPLVVLVDKGSASASEVVSGALQDHGRAVIVGETTFGKASVQGIFNLSDGSAIVITTDRYLTPKGRMIHKKGIKPDVVVKLDNKNNKDKKKQGKQEKKDKQLDKAIEIMNEFLSGKRKVELKKVS